MFTKYQKVERSEVVSPEGHQAIQSGLEKTGKTSVKDLTEDEKQKILASVPSGKV